MQNKPVWFEVTMKSKEKKTDILGFATENQLRNELIRVLQRKGIRPSIEVPFLGRSLDIVYRCADGSITVIEVKRLPKHIRRALNQAKICLLAADRVYVCTLRYNITKGTESVFRDLGVGLIFLEQKLGSFSVRYVVPAGHNGRKRKEYVAMLREALNNKQGYVQWQT